MSGASIDFHAFPTVGAALGVPAAGLPGVRRGHCEALAARGIARLTHRALGSIALYVEVVLTALASVDAEQARTFVKAELGPLAVTDDDTVRLSTRCACSSSRT